jgi:hypothetical protein
MILEDIKNKIIEGGKNPDDFNITITESGYSVTPKWFYETKQRLPGVIYHRTQAIPEIIQAGDTAGNKKYCYPGWHRG